VERIQKDFKQTDKEENVETRCTAWTMWFRSCGLSHADAIRDRQSR